MAGPAEDQDEFTAYREQRRAKGQPQADKAVDEFAQYQAQRGRKKPGRSGKSKISVLQAADVSARQGSRFGLADEAEGVKTLTNTVTQPTHPIGIMTDVAMGLGGLVMEGMSQKPKTTTDLIRGGPVENLPAKYVQGRDLSRNALTQARQDRPVTSFVGEVAGSAVYPGGALRLGAPIAGQTLKLGAIGAAQGGLYGYASSDGDMQAREDSAKIGAAFGGVAGGALPGAAAVALPVFRAGKTGVAEFADWVVGRFGGTGTAAEGNAKQVAVAAIKRSMERSGMTPEKVMEALQKFGDKPAVLAEVIGQDAVNALTSLTRRPGSTPQKAQAIIEDRFGGFVDRAQTDLERATGFKRGDIEGEKQTAIAARQSAAAPVYDNAFSQFPRVQSERLAQLGANSPTLKGYLSSAQKKLADKAAVEGKSVDQMSELDFWDLVKRTLDDDLNDAVARKQTDEIRNLTSIKDAFVGELDAITGGTYAAAREIGGEAPRLETAFRQGGQALGSRPASEIQTQVNALNPQDAPFFKAGMVSDIANRIDKGMGPNRFRVRDTQNKVRAGLGEEEGGSFLNAMEAEASLRETGARWAPRMNSVTGNVLESGPSQAVDDAITGGAALLRGDKIGALRTLVNVMRRRGYNQRQIDAMGDLLLSNPTEGLRQLGVRLPAAPAPIGAAATIGQGFEPASRIPSNALSGMRTNESGSVSGDVASGLLYGSAGGVSGNFVDYNQDGKLDWQDSAIGAGVGFGGAVVANRVGETALRALARRKPGSKTPTPDVAEPAKPMSDAKARKLYEMRQITERLGRRPTAAELDEAPWRDPSLEDTERFELEIQHLADEAGKSADGRSLIQRLYAEAQAETLQTNKNAGRDLLNWNLSRRMIDTLKKMREGDLSDLRAIRGIKPNGLPGLRGDIAPGAVGGFIGFNQDQEPITADNIATKLRNAAIGVGVGVGANRIPMRQAANALDTATTGLGGGGRGPRKPKADSPEAIAKAVRDLAKTKKPEPTRFERMVEENQIPVNSPEMVVPDAAQAAGNRAQRMLDRGKDPFEIYDETSIVYVPYNGKNIPILSPQQGPEEVIRTFYMWLQKPKETWPQFVTDIVKQAPRKRTMRLGDENAAAVRLIDIPMSPPPQTLPPAGVPYGAIAGGATLGAATGVAGGTAGYMAYDALTRDKPRNALSGQ